MPSGLLVLIEHDPYAKVAGVVSVVGGGASADPQGAEGLAHLVEHLTFRAVDATPEKPLPLSSPQNASPTHATRRERLVHHAAALTNGLTSPDAIMFFEFAPPSRLPWLIDLEAARLSDPLAGVTPAAVALEHRTIASEHELRDDPRLGQRASRQLFPLLFPSGHPYSRPVDGTSKSRDRLTLAQARAFVAENFRPERMTLLVTVPAGSITLKAIVERLPKALVGDKTHPVKRPLPSEESVPNQTLDAKIVRLASPLPVPQLWLGWALPGLWGAQGPNEELLARWIQQDLDIDYLRQEDAHIRQARVSLLPGVKASALLVRVLIDDGADANRIKKIVTGRVESLWTREQSQRPLLESLKAVFDAQVILNEPPHVERAIQQAQLVAFSAQPSLLGNHMAKVHEIQPAELAKFAYRHLGANRHRAVLYTPAPVTEAARGRRGAGDADVTQTDNLFTDAAAWDPMDLPDTPSPVNNVATRKLPDGLTVIVANRRLASTTAWLGFRGGYADSDPPLLLELALRTRPDAFDAAKNYALSDRGATRDTSIEALEFRPRDLKPALGLLFKKATAPVQKWPLRDQLDRMTASVNADYDDVSEKAAKDFYRALFGKHPLARLLQKDDLDHITRSDVDTWVGRVHNLRNAALVVVGDVSIDEVVEHATALSRSTGTPNWVESLPPLPPPALRPITQSRITPVVTARNSSLTDVSLGCLLPSMAPSDRPAYEMLRLAMQERLSSALRFERGQGYGVSVGIESVRGGTAFMRVLTFVDAQSLNDVLATLRTHWQRWSTSGFNAGEMNVARWLFAGQNALAYTSGNSIAFRLLADWNAAPEAFVAGGAQELLRRDVSAIQAERLNQLFATCKANAVLGLTGNEPAIRQALQHAWPGLN